MKKDAAVSAYVFVLCDERIDDHQGHHDRAILSKVQEAKVTNTLRDPEREKLSVEKTYTWNQTFR